MPNRRKSTTIDWRSRRPRCNACYRVGLVGVGLDPCGSQDRRETPALLQPGERRHVLEMRVRTNQPVRDLLITHRAFHGENHAIEVPTDGVRTALE